jgi:glutamate synthase (NADPH/NADH) small chain
MQHFFDRSQEFPSKRSPEGRVEDFAEIYHEYAEGAAAKQAGRCSQCGIPFCQVYCPLNNNIPDWLRLVNMGRLKEAYEVSQRTNTFPEICGRICPQDRLCEGNCVVELAGHGAITIGAIEKYITEVAWENGWVKPKLPCVERSQSVGIIGAGPAGLAAADMLRVKGFQVTIYDRNGYAGGLLVYGIPCFKLDKVVVARRVSQLSAMGVKFEMNCNVGVDIPFEEICHKHDAVLLAIGVHKPREFDILGAKVLNGVIQAADYLKESNLNGLEGKDRSHANCSLNASGKDVVVIGGGDTAMDCVRTAIRQNAKSVTCLYRRDRKNMPGSQREVAHAEEEGAKFVWLETLERLLGKGNVESVESVSTRLGARGASGRVSVENVPGVHHTHKANMVIQALGFDPENLSEMWGTDSLEVTPWGTVKLSQGSMRTSVDKVFAAGDIVRGASLVVWAIRDGRDAAVEIARVLDKQE